MKILAKTFDYSNLIIRRWRTPPDLEPEDLENLTPIREIFVKLSKVSEPIDLKSNLKPYYQDKDKCFLKFSYQSGIKTGLESYYDNGNLTVNGHLLTYKNLNNNNSSTGKNLIFFFHWWKCGSLNNIYRLTLPYLKKGYDILFLELPFHMTRNIIGMNSGELFLTPFDQFNQSVFYNAVFENQMLLLSDLVSDYQKRIAIGCDIGCTIMTSAFNGLKNSAPNFNEARYFSPFLFSANNNTLTKIINKLTKEADLNILPILSHTETTGQPSSSIEKFILYLGKWSTLYNKKDLDRFLEAWKFNQVIIKPTGHYGNFLFRLR